MHELKEIQGNNSDSGYEDMVLPDASEIEKSEIKRKHEEFKHKLEMKRAKDSLLYTTGRNGFYAAPKDTYPVNAKTKAMIESVCKKFILEHSEMKLYCGNATDVDE